MQSEQAEPLAAEQAEADAEALRAEVEALRRGLRYAVRVWVLSDEIKWSAEEIDRTVECVMCDAKEEAGDD